ncbi:MAG: hypothetical protein M1833_001116 [Piccolia ochrophora]|nr:MAG: hypothetical protein M1833_001116 [Piccolia ochrophora]
MQRAAASTPSQSPLAREEPSQKRRKLSALSTLSSSASDLQAVQKALAAEELKREEALERQAAEAGETRWALSFKRESQMDQAFGSELRVINAGYAGIDSISDNNPDSSDTEEVTTTNTAIGRWRFGHVDPKSESTSEPTHGESESMSPDDNEVPSEANQRMKASRRGAHEQGDVSRSAGTRNEASDDERNHYQGERDVMRRIKQQGISSSSGRKCFVCGSSDHLERQCPKARRGRGGKS